MKKSIFIVAVIALIGSLYLHAGEMNFNNIRITIDSSAKGIVDDPNATILPDKSVQYLCEGLMAQPDSPLRNNPIQKIISSFINKLKNAAHKGDASNLVKIYNANSVNALQPIVSNPSLLAVFFKQALLINKASWIFATYKDSTLTVYSNIESSAGLKSKTPMFFTNNNGNYEPMYPSNPSTMTMNILIALQQNLIKVEDVN